MILIHGLFGSGTEWAAMQSALQAQGYQVYAPTLPSQEVYQNAQFIHDYIAQVAGDQPVAIVAHSRGGLESRQYLKYLGGASQVTRLVELGTPNQGEWGFCLWPYPINESCPLTAFIYGLDWAGPQAPGPTIYTSLWGDFDDLASSPLQGATCNSGDLGSIQHLNEPSDPGVITKVEQALAGICP